MKKIMVAASGLLILLGVTLRAEANFFVSPQGGAANCPKKCMPNDATAWQTPIVKKTPCSTPPKTPLQNTPCPIKPPTLTTPPCSTFHAISTLPCQTPPSVCARPVKKAGICVVVYEGSLKSNVTRILRENGWQRVIWKLPVDFRWVGTARVTGPTLMTVMDTILGSFPVEITFYHANHVVTVTQRKYHE